MKARMLGFGPYALAALAAALVIALGAGREWSVDRSLFWIRGSAWCALITLGLALSASPVGGLLVRMRRAKARSVSVARRSLGISAAALATLHAGLALTTYLSNAWSVALDLSWIRSGLLAWAVLTALWLTSYPKLVARLRIKLWKPLHRLAYLAFALALHHALLSPFAPRAWVLALGGLVLVIALLRFVPRRTKPR